MNENYRVTGWVNNNGKGSSNWFINDFILISIRIMGEYWSFF